ncbi:S1 family peptidase [Streptomyces daliensis]|uniref:S1 family peptidase n=1 Tax=Streptomyces daliensis TaxID=299421 RepID=A0A8T4IVC5_9ACTN|nr:S1 family peptidase [Streptomyces daliensis]
MNHRRENSKRTYVIAGAAATALAAAVILLPHANASPDRAEGPATLTAHAAATLGSGLSSELGGKTAGWYFDRDSERLVMNVVDEETAREVRARGARARVVENSRAELSAAADTLADEASIPGTAWSADPRTNRVVVLADRTVTGADLATLRRTADAMSGTVTVRRSRGEFTPFHGDDGAEGGDSTDPSADAPGPGDGGSGSGSDGADAAPVGGDAIFGGGSRCSLGFNVTLDGAPAFLTAGHCGNASATWTSDQAGATALGTVAESRFPEADFALVAYDDTAAEAPSAVDLQDGTTREITSAAEASVGMEVQRSGSTTGLSDGTVTGLDATVNYGNGDIVNGLIQTDVCAEPGDSGGPMFAGDAAVGLTSGGSGDCTQGGETFFQPVTAALEATGAEIG